MFSIKHANQIIEKLHEPDQLVCFNAKHEFKVMTYQFQRLDKNLRTPSLQNVIDVQELAKCRGYPLSKLFDIADVIVPNVNRKFTAGDPRDDAIVTLKVYREMYKYANNYSDLYDD